MMNLFIGFSNLAIGLAYAGLGLLSAWETYSLRRYRGWSRFGIGFSLMAASCGPHHLVHGWHVLHGESVSWPMFAATLIGLPGGLTFVWLRLESMFGGRGERWITASAEEAISLAGIFALAAGSLGAWSLSQPGVEFPFQSICTSSGIATRLAGAGINFASVTFLANLFVTLTYTMVACYLSDRQVRRYLTTGAWSLSGVALSAVFFTCAQMHFIDATTRDDGLLLIFDLIGIPASIYFLRTVRQVHNDSVMDWNRRPLVGAAATPTRPSPWSEASVRG